MGEAYYDEVNRPLIREVIERWDASPTDGIEIAKANLRKLREKNMSTELATVKTTEIQEFELLQRQAKMFYESGLFSDTKSLAQAAVKIMAGRELGIGPFEAMRDVNIISGKTALAAAQVAARIQRSGGDWQPLTYDGEKCVLRFFKNGKALSPDIEFGKEEAKALGLLGRDNYSKQARTMFFWRAMTMGARMFFPGVFGGPIYTADELKGAPVEDLPEPIAVTPEPIKATIVDTPKAPANAEPLQPFVGNPFSCAIDLIEKDSKSSMNGRLICEIYFEDKGKLDVIWNQFRNTLTDVSQSALATARAHIKLGTDAELALQAFRDEHGYEPAAGEVPPAEFEAEAA